jgi:SecY interacting protein Syd
VTRSRTSTVHDALDDFVTRYLEAYPELFEVFDEEWRSPCEISPPSRGRVQWRPSPRKRANDFAGLERALAIEIHPDIKAYFGSFWSGDLEAEADDGHVSLLFLWNADDVDRLVENLIGHALQKRRRRQPFNVFFACTEKDSELILAVDNDTGEVILEAPDKPPLRTVADDLATFLSTLRPASPTQHSERSLA